MYRRRRSRSRPRRWIVGARRRAAAGPRGRVAPSRSTGRGRGEHEDVVGHVADRRDLLGRDLVRLGEEATTSRPCSRAGGSRRGSTAGARRGDVVSELVLSGGFGGRRTAACRRSRRRSSRRRFEAVVAVDHGRLELHGVRFACDVRPVRVAYVPVGSRYTHTESANDSSSAIDGATSSSAIVRSSTTSKCGSTTSPPLKRRAGRERQRLDEHRHAAGGRPLVTAK